MPPGRRAALGALALLALAALLPLSGNEYRSVPATESRVPAVRREPAIRDRHGRHGVVRPRGLLRSRRVRGSARRQARNAHGGRPAHLTPRAVAGALAVGWFCVRVSGVYLAMLTLAFAQIAGRSPSSGMKSPVAPTGRRRLAGPWIASKAAYYWFALALAAACTRDPGVDRAHASRLYVARVPRSPLRAAAIGVESGARNGPRSRSPADSRAWPGASMRSRRGAFRRRRWEFRARSMRSSCAARRPHRTGRTTARGRGLHLARRYARAGHGILARGARCGDPHHRNRLSVGIGGDDREMVRPEAASEPTSFVKSIDEKKLRAGQTSIGVLYFTRLVSPRPPFEKHVRICSETRIVFTRDGLKVRRLVVSCRKLLSERGEAAGVSLARITLDRYRELDEGKKRDSSRPCSPSSRPIRRRCSQRRTRMRRAVGLQSVAAEHCRGTPTPGAALAAESGAGGTATILRMRELLLELKRDQTELDAVDWDMRHLLSSWFNPGFLQIVRVDWHTPAYLLEQIIIHEAVHEIRGWNDLRRRLAVDGRCFAFFHPALPDEPLIFLEVALMDRMADSVPPLLDAQSTSGDPARPPLPCSIRSATASQACAAYPSATS